MKQVILDEIMDMIKQHEHVTMKKVLDSILIKKSLFSNQDITPSVNGEPLLHPGVFIIDSAKKGTLFKGAVSSSKINPLFGVSKGLGFTIDSDSLKLLKSINPGGLTNLLITDNDKTESIDLSLKEKFTYENKENAYLLISMQIFCGNNYIDSMLITGSVFETQYTES